MVLRMPFLRLNPRTKIYEYRRRVPDDLRHLVGKREEKKSFGTRDRNVANLRYAIHHAEVEARWAGLRRGTIMLDRKQCEALAGEVYERILKEDGGKKFASLIPPPFMELWNMEVVDGDLPTPKHRALGPYSEELEAIHGERVDALLLERGLDVDGFSRQRLLQAVQRAAKQAKRVVVRQIGEGDYAADPQASRFPKFNENGSAGLPLRDLVRLWVAARKPARDTANAWSNNIEKFIAFSKIEDAHEIEPRHVSGWRNALRAQGIGAVRIRDGYIASLKAVLSHGVAECGLAGNAAAGIKVTEEKKQRNREKDLNNEEIFTILTASLKAYEGEDLKLSEDTRAARRWAPWLCAYSGARIAEITALEYEHIIEEEGFHGISILRSKSGLARKVPLHPHVIEQGFLQFVASRGPGPLFLRRSNGRSESGPKSRSEKLANWVRRVGVKDKAVSPNHGWRHRFRTEARLIFMREEFINYIMGHSPGHEGQRYGHVPFGVTGPWIALLPRFDVSGASLKINRTKSIHALKEMMALMNAPADIISKAG